MVSVTRRAAAFDALLEGLQGRLPEDADWEAVIALANRTLLTPTLFEALADAGQLGRVPRGAADYLQFIHGCSLRRNVRLRAQLLEILRAFNDRDIRPTLLKGAIPLFLAERAPLTARITSDLDMAVDASEEGPARDCLLQLGYRPIPGDRGMAREDGAGVVELRRGSPPPGLEPPRLVERHGVRALVPGPEARALHLLVHDLLKEGDYWRGRIDLRHMHDLAQLAQGGGIAWEALRARLPGRHARNAFDTQLLSLERLFGVPTAGSCSRRRIARLQHWRRVLCARHPVAGMPLHLGGSLSWGLRRLIHGGAFTGGPGRFARRVVRTLFHRRSRV